MFDLFWDNSRGAPAIRVPGVDYLSAQTGILSGRVTSLSSEAVPTDYPVTDAGVRLCSEKLRQTIDAFASEDDRLTWEGPISVDVVRASRRCYYVLKIESDT